MVCPLLLLAGVTAVARRKPHEEPENPERWMVSYADFITLLFAFFVVMYAISSINEGKYRVLSDSLESAFQQPQAAVRAPTGAGRILPGGGQVLPEPGIAEPSEHMKQVAQNVYQAMQPLVEAGEVRVTQSPKGVTVEINAKNLFSVGDATLTPQAVQSLAAVAQVLTTTPNAIQVEGHTDNIPINTPAFPSNWELSSARAGSVVRLFTELGIPAERMVAIGYADNRPVDTNASADGRARNRRVNVLILDAAASPAAHTAPGTPSPASLAPPAAR